MSKETIVTAGLSACALSVLNMVFGELIHPDRDDTLLNVVVSVVGMTAAATASWGMKSEQKPWIRPHDPWFGPSNGF